jgi:hypothetical protein
MNSCFYFGIQGAWKGEFNGTFEIYLLGSSFCDAKSVCITSPWEWFNNKFVSLSYSILLCPFTRLPSTWFTIVFPILSPFFSYYLSLSFLFLCRIPFFIFFNWFFFSYSPFSSCLFSFILLSFHYLDFQLSYFHFPNSVISSRPARFSTYFTSYLLPYFFYSISLLSYYLLLSFLSRQRPDL